MKRNTRELFIENASNVHNHKYDYSEVSYVNNKTLVSIICKEHGEFKQRPDRHLQGQGCPVCRYMKSALSNKKTLEEFIEEAKLVHGNKYDYSKSIYVNYHTKIYIICPKHGGFWQTPAKHLAGQGCPVCDESHLEKEIRIFLTNENEEFVQEYKCKWLGKQTLDFYLPSYNVGIECQGKQHFGLGGWISGDFERIKERDVRKKKLCDERGVKLLYYSNLGIEYPYKVFENKSDMLKEIKYGQKT